MRVEEFIDNDVDPTSCESKWGDLPCVNAPAWLLITISRPGFALMCEEHRAGFEGSVQGHDYTVEPYTLERAKELQRFVSDHYRDAHERLN
jgi:hypothetical protein